MVGVSYDLIQI